MRTKVTADSTDELILAIHRCALDPSGWREVIASIAARSRADQAWLITPGVPDAVGLPNAMPSCLVENFDSYRRHYYQHDLWVRRGFDRGLRQTGRVCVDDEMVDRAEFKASPIFNEFLRRMDVDRALIATVQAGLPASGMPMTALTLTRRVGAAAFEEADANSLRQVIPHLSLAVENYWRWRTLEAQHTTIGRALDTVSAPVLGLDGNGRCRYLNQTAVDALRAGRWLTRAPGERVVPGPDLIDGADLAGHLHRLLKRNLAFSTVATHGPTLERALLTGAPCADGQPRWQADTAIAAFLWIMPLLEQPASISLLQDLFRLTPAEARLLQRISHGETLVQVAQQSAISLNTAKSHLKSIFAKTGTRRQSELAALVHRVSMFRRAAD